MTDRFTAQVGAAWSPVVSVTKPDEDTPIVVDENGHIVSRYRDSIWDFTCWVGRRVTINFGDGRRTRKSHRIISKENADILRRIAFMWLYEERSTRSPVALRSKFSEIRGIFVLCTERGIAASELFRFPKLIEELPSFVPQTVQDRAFTCLHRLFERRKELGFQILDREGLRRFRAILSLRKPEQMPYIPPRIWQYQLDRLLTFIDDYVKHQSRVEACYRYCLEMYGKKAQSIGGASSEKFVPFSGRDRSEYGGSFRDVAKRLELEALLDAWATPESGRLGILNFSSFLTFVTHAALTVLMSICLMRKSEASSLRCDCLSIEVDPDFGPIYLVRGVTKKTLKDDAAIWVGSPEVERAVRAAASIARLRTEASLANPVRRVHQDDVENPLLLSYVGEPWIRNQGTGTARSPSLESYGNLVEGNPRLFDERELTINADDLRLAKMFNASMNPERFSVGCVWRLSFHQLRRTGAVNMQASGLVSVESVQYQLKHARRSMALYYGRGYSRVSLNAAAQDEYVRALYEVMTQEIDQLASDGYVSPLGPEHKANVLKLISVGDVKDLERQARDGRVSFRETLLGACTSRVPCTFGGIDNLVHCAGGDGSKPCPDAFFDRRKRQRLKDLLVEVEALVNEAGDGSRQRTSLEAQCLSLRVAIGALEDGGDDD